MPAVVAIYTAPSGGAPMTAHAERHAIAGVGLEGDRYAAGTGHYSAREGRGRELTLIAREAIASAGAQRGVRLGEHEVRRNLVTEGVDLGALVGKQFAVGGAVLVGIRDCPPCAYLEGLTCPGVRAALEGGGGLRAEIVRSGTVRVGDPVGEIREARDASRPERPRTRARHSTA